MSQKSFEVLLELKTLETLFGGLSEAKGKLYTEQLEKFPLDVIKRAVKKVSGKWDKPSFPPIGAVVKACEQVSAGSTAFTSGQAFPWLTRNRAQHKAIAEYMHTYRTCALMREAVSEKWDGPLEKYVREIASIQAQLLHPPSDGRIGLSWNLIQIDGLTREDAGRWQKEFLAEMRRALSFSGNMISVDVPAAKIDEWKEIARRFAPTSPGYQQSNYAPIKHSFPPMEDYHAEI